MENEPDLPEDYGCGPGEVRAESAENTVEDEIATCAKSWVHGDLPRTRSECFYFGVETALRLTLQNINVQIGSMLSGEPTIDIRVMEAVFLKAPLDKIIEGTKELQSLQCLSDVPDDLIAMRDQLRALADVFDAEVALYDEVNDD